ncbi:MAG: hypothetical protein K2X87_18805 [Gemmataceae bacterium]|nr:hypothetical protein [Gemmataceae bacterium]
MRTGIRIGIVLVAAALAVAALVGYRGGSCPCCGGWAWLTPAPGPAGEAPAGSAANLAKLPADDRARAEAQKVCPVTGEPLGSMGVPVKLTLQGEAVFVCCKGCVGKAEADPDRTLKAVADAKAKSAAK